MLLSDRQKCSNMSVPLDTVLDVLAITILRCACVALHADA